MSSIILTSAWFCEIENELEHVSFIRRKIEENQSITDDDLIDMKRSYLSTATHFHNIGMIYAGFRKVEEKPDDYTSILDTLNSYLERAEILLQSIEAIIVETEKLRSDFLKQKTGFRYLPERMQEKFKASDRFVDMDVVHNQENTIAENVRKVYDSLAYLKKARPVIYAKFVVGIFDLYQRSLIDKMYSGRLIEPLDNDKFSTSFIADKIESAYTFNNGKYSIASWL